MKQETREFTKTDINSLKPTELAMWQEYLKNGFVKIDAFVKINKNARERMASGEITDKNHFYRQCSKYFKKIEAVIGQENLLEAHGLGTTRVMRELDKRLDAKTTKYWQGASLGEHTDNSTRMKATELLSRLNGMDKPAPENTGSAGVQFYIPDNGRDNQGDNK